MRPKLLDLFCNAGGAGMGYSRAGFDVFGVDLHRQKNYPFPMHQGDAIELLQALVNGEAVAFTRKDGSVELLTLADFDAIHASPPCQGYTALRHAPGTRGAPLLIESVRGLLTLTERPWIIENVEEAKWAMVDPITLCGSMFGLGAQGCQLRRHRLFESNIAISPPSPCKHDSRPVIGVYGGHARRRSASAGGRGTRDVWEGGHRAAMSQAMGMTWATTAEMSEAIPPAYTHHLGRQILIAIAPEDVRDLLG